MEPDFLDNCGLRTDDLNRETHAGADETWSFRPRPWNDVSGFRALFRLNLERGLYDGGWYATLQHGQTRTSMTGCCPLQAKIRGLLSEVLRYTFAFPMHYFPRVGAYSPAQNSGSAASVAPADARVQNLSAYRRLIYCAQEEQKNAPNPWMKLFSPVPPRTFVRARARAHVTFYSTIFYESDLLTRAIPDECFLDRSMLFDIIST